MGVAATVTHESGHISIAACIKSLTIYERITNMTDPKSPDRNETVDRLFKQFLTELPGSGGAAPRQEHHVFCLDFNTKDFVGLLAESVASGKPCGTIIVNALSVYAKLTDDERQEIDKRDWVLAFGNPKTVFAELRAHIETAAPAETPDS